MICRDDLPETPDWTLPPRVVVLALEHATIASAELDPLGTE